MQAAEQEHWWTVTKRMFITLFLTRIVLPPIVILIFAYTYLAIKWLIG